MGIVLEVTNQHLTVTKYPFWQAPVAAASEVAAVLVNMLKGLGVILGDLWGARRVPREVTGVVGIKVLTDVAAEMGERFLLQFVAILSLNLLVFNLLPIPALDGGRLLFVALEALSGRRIPPRVERWINNLGFALLLTLFVLITIRDIVRFY